MGARWCVDGLLGLAIAAWADPPPLRRWAAPDPGVTGDLHEAWVGAGLSCTLVFGS